MLQPPSPVQTLDLFADDRAALLQLLSSLTPDEWNRPTVCSNWSVKDVALHVLGGDLATSPCAATPSTASIPHPAKTSWSSSTASTKAGYKKPAA